MTRLISAIRPRRLAKAVRERETLAPGLICGHLSAQSFHMCRRSATMCSSTATMRSRTAIILYLSTKYLHGSAPRSSHLCRNAFTLWWYVDRALLVQFVPPRYLHTGILLSWRVRQGYLCYLWYLWDDIPQKMKILVHCQMSGSPCPNILSQSTPTFCYGGVLPPALMVFLTIWVSSMLKSKTQ